MACKPLGSICLRVGEVKPYAIDLTTLCALRWVPGEIRGLGEFIRPRLISEGGDGANGYEYELTTAGQSGENEPSWPTTPGETVTDGSAIWTCRAISNSSLGMTIANSDWDGPEIVSFSAETSISTNGEQKTAAKITGVSVGQGLVVNEVTFSDGRNELFTLKVTVRAANK